jgi:hypothetical protein
MKTPAPVRSKQISIDLDDLQKAREDERLRTLIKDARAEGEFVRREGRQRW